MGIYIAGQEYDNIYAGGQRIRAAEIRGQEYHTTQAPDTPGTLSVTVTRSGRNYAFEFSVTDPNGIRTLTAATVTARDGTQANALADFTRQDANTYAGSDSRRNARWASGTMSVTYVDATSGNSVTVTQTWTT